MTFGDKLRILRKSKKLSQQQIGIWVDAADTTVSDWEHNRHYPSVKTIKKLCELLDTTPNFLINDNDNDDIEIRIKYETYDKESLDTFFNYYSKLNAKDKKLINQLMESLSNK